MVSEKCPSSAPAAESRAAAAAAVAAAAGQEAVPVCVHHIRGGERAVLRLRLRPETTIAALRVALTRGLGTEAGGSEPSERGGQAKRGAPESHSAGERGGPRSSPPATPPPSPIRLVHMGALLADDDVRPLLAWYDPADVIRLVPCSPEGELRTQGWPNTRDLAQCFD
jgi:hypothetical protein